jgi:hypothetical protein
MLLTVLYGLEMWLGAGRGGLVAKFVRRTYRIALNKGSEFDNTDKG